jgi:hypothetical protein
MGNVQNDRDLDRSIDHGHDIRDNRLDLKETNKLPDRDLSITGQK